MEVITVHDNDTCNANIDFDNDNALVIMTFYDNIKEDDDK
jgi:hypothetical protein